MSILPYLVTGVATGAIYGLLASGLVLTYRSSGVFNFGYGAIATVGAYLFYFLHIAHGQPWWLALAITVVIAGPAMGFGMEQLGRRLAFQQPRVQIATTIGLILLVQGLGSVKYGGDTVLVSQYLPHGNDTFRMLGVFVPYSRLVIFIVGLVALSSLHFMLRRTATGMAMRAVVDDPELVAMHGINPIRVRRIAWVIGCSFAALAGVLILPFIGLNALALTLIAIQAFGAAAIGGFKSIPISYLGGIVIAVAADILRSYSLDVSWLAGLPDCLPFIVLFIALLVWPKRRLAAPVSLTTRHALPWRAPTRVRVLVGAILVVALATVPGIVEPSKINTWTVGLSQVVLLLSLGILVRMSGQVSLCQAAFAGIGAAVFSQFTVQLGIPWLLAAVLAGLVVVPVGVAVAIPAMRLSGIFLALATLGFGIVAERLFYGRNFLFTSFENGRSIPRPYFATSDSRYYYVALAFVVVSASIVLVLERSRLGRLLRGMSDAPIAVETLGLRVSYLRMAVFAISAFLAAIAGILYAGTIHFATASDSQFSSFNSMFILAVLIISPFGEPWYALVGGAAIVIGGYIPSGDINFWLSALFGASAVAVGLQRSQPSMPHSVRRLFERWASRSSPAPLAAVEPAEHPTTRRSIQMTRPGLEARHLTVRFGGMTAVDDVSLSAPLSRITGLIGPNGAGKTTIFDACSGLNRRVSGDVAFRGRSLAGLGPSARGRAGIGRTFQRMQLADSLTVTENVGLGYESADAGKHPWSQFGATRASVRDRDQTVASSLALTGIADLADKQAGALSTGQRRLVELARCLAGPFDLLLLDEPSSGLDPAETAAFVDVLQHVVEKTNCGVLLVEHDMSLVMTLCSYIYVLDFGQLIFEGRPHEVSASTVVQAAYLGSEVGEPNVEWSK